MPMLAMADRQARRPERLPLSFAQRRLWFLYRLEGPGGAYNAPLAVRLSGKLDREALEAALQDVLVRHAALRTVFLEADGQPYQELVPGDRTSLALQPGEAGDVGEAGLAAALADAARRGFDLSRELPVRARLFRVSVDDHVLLVVTHRIAVDGWSLRTLGHDLGVAYAARCAGREPPWAPSRVQYADYALSQHELLSGEGDQNGLISTQVAYWTSALAGLPADLAVPADRPRPAVTSHRGGSVPLRLDAELHARLLDLARRSETTLFTMLQAGLAALLTRFGAGTDIPVGSQVPGRTDEMPDDVVGCFANTLVLRTDTSGDPSFLELLGRIREVDRQAYMHKDVPFEYLVQVLNPARSMARHPLFQIMLALESTPAVTHFAGLWAEPVLVDLATATLDLSFSLTERVGADGTPAGLSGDLVYAADLFGRDTAAMIATRLVRLLSTAAADPELPVGQLELLSSAERRGLLVAGSGPVAQVVEAGVAELFAAQAARSPDAVAVVSGDSALTYRELAARSKRLAGYLMRGGVGPDVLVGLCAEPGMEMVTGLLGILAAGGAYVPIDPGYPVERVAFMLQDCGVSLVLTLERLRDRPPVDCLDLICLDTEWDAIATGADDIRLPAAHPASLAYVTYTSGSTGTPKGVAVTNRNIVNLISDRCWHNGNHGRMLFHSPYSFDASTYELWVPLLSGGRVVMATESRIDAIDLEYTIAKNDVTAAYFTTALFEVMSQEAIRGLGQLREIWTGGDVISAAAIQRVLDKCPDTTVMHAYGPTETTVFCSFQPFGAARRQVTALTLGYPMDNTRMYLLDGRLRPTPPGATGEIYLAGEGVAREYLKRPGLAAGRFVADPFGSPGARMYRTGDVARRRADSELEFIGRADDQVKVRGFRVEPGEVEAVLAQHPMVGRVVVVAREDNPGDKRLVAYVVPTARAQVNAGELREFARESLPDYLVPSVFAVVGRLPLTPNGKLDRRALPPPGKHRESGREHVAPRTRAEKAVARMWSQVLGARQVGLHDSFFELGGDSYLAVQALSRLETLFQVEIPVRAIFQYPAIADLLDELRTIVTRAKTKQEQRKVGSSA
jgi:amino acid adenylation domain-containing protein